MASNTKAKNKNKGKVAKIIGAIFLSLVMLASLLLIFIGIDYMKDPPTTQKTLYGNRLTYADEELFEGVPCPVEINVYTNERKNGVPCYEVRLNYYTDTTIPEFDEETGKPENTKFVYGVGYQVTDKISYEQEETWQIFEWSFHYKDVITNGCYYNTSDGQSYSPINKLDSNDKWIFDYGYGEGLLRVSEKGDVQGDDMYLWKHRFYWYGINNFLITVLESTSTLEDGEHYLNLDVSDYFNFQVYDTESKQFKSPGALKTDVQNLFLFAKVTKSSNGLTEAKQSLFGAVNYKTDYRYDNVNLNDEYYRSLTLYTLEEDDFDFVDGKAILKQACYDYLRNFSKMYLKVIFNLDETDCSGFIENAFYGLDIDEIVLTSSTEKIFTSFEDYNFNTSQNVTVEVIT